MKIKLLFFLTLLHFTAFSQETVTNRYSMKLEDNGDGTYTLINSRRYAELFDLSDVPDLLVPYTYVPDKITSADYKGVQTVEKVYKTYPGYELSLIVDLAVSTEPAPFMIYIHGGGWARGNNGLNRPLSQYLARQKGVAGVRIAYTLSPQPDADIYVTIQDVLDAVEYIKDHAAEFNIDPDRFGFCGASAGAHLSAVGALKTGARVMVGYLGIYDLTKAAITVRARDLERIAYFKNKDMSVLADVSPVNMIPEDDLLAFLLVSGTGDITVEYAQSRLFRDALAAKGADVILKEYEYYDHNISAKASDLMEECMLMATDFITRNIF